jgi:hypothetical protein
VRRGSALRRRAAAPSDGAGDTLPPGVEWRLESLSSALFEWLVSTLDPECPPGTSWDFMRTIILDDPDNPRGTKPRPAGETLEEFLATERAAIADGSGVYPRRAT